MSWHYQLVSLVGVVFLATWMDGWTDRAEAKMVRVVVRAGAQEFTPHRVTIRPGDQVIWVNADLETHSVVSAGSESQQAANGPDDPLINASLPPGANYGHVFQEIGTYDYFCANHMQAWGVVVSEE